LKDENYGMKKLLFCFIIINVIIFFNYTFEKKNIFNNQIIDYTFLQNSYALENKTDSEQIIKDKRNPVGHNSISENTTNITTNPQNKESNFNFIAVGDWDCNEYTKDTVYNIIRQDPELVLALGDLSYNGKAQCWIQLIEPFKEKTKIVIGNHEVDSSKLLKDYMDQFGLENQYYSFNQKNVHFLALSTEIPYYNDSEQFEFAIKDLEKSSNDPLIGWIIVFYHKHMYGSGPGFDEEKDFRKIYHPLFDKYKVDLALQGHLHVYERTFPVSFNYETDKPNNKLDIVTIYDEETDTEWTYNRALENDPIVQDNATNIYKNPKGTIFVTVGTGGAHSMNLGSLEDFTVKGLYERFGILNLELQNDENVLSGKFIENGKEQKKIPDEFKIIKDKN
jgi:Calcineurin-like phosphoesterase